MSKINNQSKSLDNIKFVRDIDLENAAKYSGGAVRFNDGNNDPDVIFFSDSNFRGRRLNLNASTGDGPRLFPRSFNDVTSSLIVRKGTWIFYKDANYGGGNQEALLLRPGSYRQVPSNRNDQFSSARRIGA